MVRVDFERNGKLSIRLKAEQSWPISSRVRTGTVAPQSPAEKRFTPAVSSRSGPSSARDSRVVERKKYGKAKARRSVQFSKR